MGRLTPRCGQKTVSRIDRLVAVSRYQVAWEKHCDDAQRVQSAKRIRANWTKLRKVPVEQRGLVLQLADSDELPSGLPRLIREAVHALKKNRAILNQQGRIRSRARPYSKRERLLKRIASEESSRLGIQISWQQLRRWCDRYENLISR